MKYRIAIFFILSFLQISYISICFSWYFPCPYAVNQSFVHPAGFGSKPSHLCSCVFQVKYWRNHEDSEGGAQRVVVPSRENHTRLEGMKANSQYLVEVRGYNSAGYGPASERLQIHTKKARTLSFKAVHYKENNVYLVILCHFNVIVPIFVSFTSSKSTPENNW